MTIDTIPTSPNGEVEHGEIREKLNELVDAMNQLGIVSHGFVDYNDSATETTPIAVLSGVTTVLTNDTLGAQTNRNHLPENVTDLWNSSTNSFDFSQLAVGDHVQIRMHLKVTTTANNTAIKAFLTMAEGTPTEYTIPYSNGLYKTSTVDDEISRYNSFYIGNEDVRDAPTKLQVLADEDCSIKVVGFYCVVTRRS